MQQLLLKQNGVLKDHNFYFGGRFLGSYIYERTNTAGKYPILSRLPPTHTSGKSDGYTVVNDISAQSTLVVPYFTFYAQGEYTEIQYPGQRPTQLRKAFVAIGKKSVNFGDMSSYTPITPSHSSHYFWAQNTHNALFEFGYYKTTRILRRLFFLMNVEIALSTQLNIIMAMMILLSTAITFLILTIKQS